MTATPLIMFSYAAKRVRLATVGLVQYINPTLQFFVATFVFRELFSFWHAIAFALIWLALAIYTLASLRQDRALRNAADSSCTLPTT
jgi:chloramphenicol-sensitive protein RarD